MAATNHKPGCTCPFCKPRRQQRRAGGQRGSKRRNYSMKVSRGWTGQLTQPEPQVPQVPRPPQVRVWFTIGGGYAACVDCGDKSATTFFGFDDLFARTLITAIGRKEVGDDETIAVSAADANRLIEMAQAAQARP